MTHKALEQISRDILIGKLLLAFLQALIMMSSSLHLWKTTFSPSKEIFNIKCFTGLGIEAKIKLCPKLQGDSE